MKSCINFNWMFRVWSRAIAGLIVVSLIAGSTAALAHQGDRIVPIYEITDDMLELIDLKDGRIDEWEDFFEPSLTTLDFFAYTSVTTREIVPYDPSDLDFRIWLGWNATHDRLYLSFQAADDVYKIREKINQTQDGLELRVDGDHSGGEYRFFSGPRYRDSMGPAQAYFAPSFLDMDSSIELHFGDSEGMEALEWVDDPPYADGGEGSVGGNPVFWVLEFYVTPFDELIWNDQESSLPSELVSGKVVGFFIRIADFDSQELLTNYMIDDAFLKRQGNPASDANLFVDGVLLPAGEILEDSAVQPSSWGLIKASFKETTKPP